MPSLRGPASLFDEVQQIALAGQVSHFDLRSAWRVVSGGRASRPPPRPQGRASCWCGECSARLAARWRAGRPPSKAAPIRYSRKGQSETPPKKATRTGHIGLRCIGCQAPAKRGWCLTLTCAAHGASSLEGGRPALHRARKGVHLAGAASVLRALRRDGGRDALPPKRRPSATAGRVKVRHQPKKASRTGHIGLRSRHPIIPRGRASPPVGRAAFKAVETP